mgnify:CR=1 FL=1
MDPNDPRGQDDVLVGRIRQDISQDGGVEIEKVAAETPEKILKVFIDPLVGMTDAQALELATGIGVAVIDSGVESIDGIKGNAREKKWSTIAADMIEADTTLDPVVSGATADFISASLADQDVIGPFDDGRCAHVLDGPRRSHGGQRDAGEVHMGGHILLPDALIGHITGQLLVIAEEGAVLPVRSV